MKRLNHRGHREHRERRYGSRSLCSRWFIFFLVVAIPALAAAQDNPKLRQQRDELTRIRLQRAELERQMSELQNTAHDLREEVNNLRMRADITARLVRTLDAQLV